MNSLQIAAYGALSFAGFAGISEAAGAQLDWKDLASGGSATMVIVVVALFLRAQSELRQEHSELVNKISQDFSETVQTATKQYAESTHKIIEGARQHNQANLAMLQQIISDMRETK